MKVYSSCGRIFNSTDVSDFEVGQTYYEGDRIEIKPSELTSHYTVDAILEYMEEMLLDMVGEVAEGPEGSINLSHDKRSELLAIIDQFLNEHADVSCYVVDNIIEAIAE